MRTLAGNICTNFAGQKDLSVPNVAASTATTSKGAINISAYNAAIRLRSHQEPLCIKASFPCKRGFGRYTLFQGTNADTPPLSSQEELNIAYSSAWYLLHRIRRAMAERDSEYMLSGIVELDDTYFGAPTEGGKRGRGTEKAKVMVAVSKTENGKPGYLKMQVVDNLKGETVGDFAKACIVKGSIIQSDAYRSYRKPLAEDFDHQFEVYDSNSDTLKWLHTLVGNVKALVNGTFHGLGDKHLQSYLDEFCYRFNRRGFRTQIFPRLLCAVANSNILGYADLTR